MCCGVCVFNGTAELSFASQMKGLAASMYLFPCMQLVTMQKKAPDIDLPLPPGSQQVSDSAIQSRCPSNVAAFLASDRR